MTVYLRSHRRRPVRLRQPWGRTDVQGEIPWFWCCRCGAEVFLPGAIRCSRCEKEVQNGKDIC